MPVTSDWVAQLAASRRSLERASTTERVAGILRALIIEGAVAPGERLPEDRIRETLRVSRNTLREAFRLLGHERLLVYEFGRGMFVAKPTAHDVAELYQERRIVEVGALREAAGADAAAIARLGAAIKEGCAAVERGDWPGVGTANMRFHAALAALAGNSRVDEHMGRLLAEMRLVFHEMGSPRELHVPYLEENQKLFELLRDGRLDVAVDRLTDYLNAAERQIVAVFQRRRPAED